jgi:hypothetical protein
MPGTVRLYKSSSGKLFGLIGGEPRSGYLLHATDGKTLVGVKHVPDSGFFTFRSNQLLAANFKIAHPVSREVSRVVVRPDLTVIDDEVYDLHEEAHDLETSPYNVLMHFFNIAQLTKDERLGLDEVVYLCYSPMHEDKVLLRSNRNKMFKLYLGGTLQPIMMSYVANDGTLVVNTLDASFRFHPNHVTCNHDPMQLLDTADHHITFDDENNRCAITSIAAMAA